ncbi:hypothetical protein ACNKHL_09695 [Shigella flexneri]
MTSGLRNAINRSFIGQGAGGTLQVVIRPSGNRVKVISMNCASQPKAKTECDIYPLRVGIRSVAVKGEQYLINHKPFYFYWLWSS